MLKGGTGILARIRSSRSTQDIDLYRQALTLDQALQDLRRLAAIDLGDHFRFEYTSHSSSLAVDTQPYTDGYRVTFRVFIGVAAKGSLGIDLVVGTSITDDVTRTTPATTLKLPRLISYPYRLYPVVDQIADKVCATVASFKGEPSSRQKDLVDLVVFAVTQDIDGDALKVALERERSRRQIAPFTTFVVPSNWGDGYTKLSRPVPHCLNYPTVKAAADLASELINPALTGQASGKLWSHTLLRWT